MTIDRLGPIDPVSRYAKAGKATRPEKKEASDSISFSEEGKMKAELYKVVESVKTAPDVRLDKVAEVKKKLEDPNYINDKIVADVADRIIDLFDL